MVRDGDVVAISIDTGAGDREVHAMSAAAVSSWCASADRLLTLRPADSWDDLASYRSPWLLTADGSRVLALRAHVEPGQVRLGLEASLGGGTIVSERAEAGEIVELIRAMPRSR